MTWIQVATGALALGAFVTAGFLSRAGMAAEAASVAAFGGFVLGSLTPQLGAKK